MLNGGRRGELRACGASPAPRAAAGSADVPIPADKGLSSRAGSPRPAAGARHRSGRSAHARSFLPSGRPRTALPPVPSRLGAGELGPKAVTRSGGYRGNPQRSWQRHWQVHRPLSAFRNIESRHKDSCSQAARLQEGPIPWAGSAGGAGSGPLRSAQPAPRSSVSPLFPCPGGPQSLTQHVRLSPLHKRGYFPHYQRGDEYNGAARHKNEKVENPHPSQVVLDQRH